MTKSRCSPRCTQQNCCQVVEIFMNILKNNVFQPVVYLKTASLFRNTSLISNEGWAGELFRDLRTNHVTDVTSRLENFPTTISVANQRNIQNCMPLQGRTFYPFVAFNFAFSCRVVPRHKCSWVEDFKFPINHSCSCQHVSNETEGFASTFWLAPKKLWFVSWVDLTCVQ